MVVNNGDAEQYNGLDRVDSNLGYVAGNVVPCCRWCNQAKSSRPVGEFLTWLRLFGCTKTEKAIKLAASEIAREVATHGGKQQALRFRPAKGVSAQHELTEKPPAKFYMVKAENLTPSTAGIFPL